MVGRRCGLRLPPVRFLAPHGFVTHRLAYMLDSLVRVSRRVDWNHSANTLSAQVLAPETRASDLGRADGTRVYAASPTRVDPPPASRRARWARQNQAATGASNRFPLNNFRHFLTLFSKFFSSFPHGTCSLSVSRPYLALDGIYHPLWAAFPNNPTPRQRLVERRPHADGVLTLCDAPFQGTWACGSRGGRVSRLQFAACAEIFKLGSSRFTRRY